MTNTAAPIADGLLTIESMDLEAQGIAHDHTGKVVFVDNALPGERVTVQFQRSKAKWAKALAVERSHDASLRINPACSHFGFHQGACGGCKMQHVHPMAQVSFKQRSLLDQLWHLGKCRPETIIRPLTGPTSGYRHRGRLSVRYVAKRDEVLIGFHERNSRYIADMSRCEVLPPRLSNLLLPLRQLIRGLNALTTIPQIEFAVGDRALALVIRHLEPLVEDDLVRLRAFAQTHSIEWWLQPKGPTTVHLLDEQVPSGLGYDLPEFGIHMPYKPTDFTQVNPNINRWMVLQAIQLLNPKHDDTVVDWFCGLGNFTLPLATRCHAVMGIEGSEALVARAHDNWEHNQALRAQRQLTPLAPARFETRNLFEFSTGDFEALPQARLWLIDPPREGAFALCKALSEACLDPLAMPSGWRAPERIVYVSCNPATLARDAGLLVHQAGYRCVGAGMMDMFPHTAHVESMAVFERT